MAKAGEKHRPDHCPTRGKNEAATDPPPRSHAHDGILQHIHPHCAVYLFRASVNPSPPVVLTVYSLYSVGLLFTYLTQSTYTPSPKMNSYATGGKYGVASEAMLCSSIAELHRLHEFPPPTVVCHAMGTSDSQYILGRLCVYGIIHDTAGKLTGTCRGTSDSIG